MRHIELIFTFVCKQTITYLKSFMPSRVYVDVFNSFTPTKAIVSVERRGLNGVNMKANEKTENAED